MNNYNFLVCVGSLTLNRDGVQRGTDTPGSRIARIEAQGFLKVGFRPLKVVAIVPQHAASQAGERVPGVRPDLQPDPLVLLF